MVGNHHSFILFLPGSLDCRGSFISLFGTFKGGDVKWEASNDPFGHHPFDERPFHGHQADGPTRNPREGQREVEVNGGGGNTWCLVFVAATAGS